MVERDTVSLTKCFCDEDGTPLTVWYDRLTKTYFIVCEVCEETLSFDQANEMKGGVS